MVYSYYPLKAIMDGLVIKIDPHSHHHRARTHDLTQHRTTWRRFTRVNLTAGDLYYISLQAWTGWMKKNKFIQWVGDLIMGV